MGIALIRFKLMHCSGLPGGNIDPEIHWFHQYILPVNKGFAFILRCHNSVGQEDRFLWAGIFAIATVDAPEHIDFVNCRIFLLTIEVFFSRFPLSRDHGYRFGRTGNST